MKMKRRPWGWIECPDCGHAIAIPRHGDPAEVEAEVNEHQATHGKPPLFSDPSTTPPPDPSHT